MYEQSMHLRKKLPHAYSTEQSIADRSIEEEKQGNAGEDIHDLSGGMLKKLLFKCPCFGERVESNKATNCFPEFKNTRNHSDCTITRLERKMFR